MQVALKEGWFKGVGSYMWRFKWTEFSASSLERVVVGGGEGLIHGNLNGQVSVQVAFKEGWFRGGGWGVLYMEI